jgi:hypothetical protein
VQAVRKWGFILFVSIVLASSVSYIALQHNPSAVFCDGAEGACSIQWLALAPVWLSWFAVSLLFMGVVSKASAFLRWVFSKLRTGSSGGS